MKKQRRTNPRPQGRPKGKINRLFSEENIKKFLFFLFAFLLPTQLGRHFFLPFSYITGVRIDYLAPTLYLTDVLAVALVFAHIRLFTPLLKHKKPLAIIFILILLNVLFSLSKPLAVYRIIKLTEAAALWMIFRSSYRAYKKQVVAGLALSTLMQTVLVVLQLLKGGALQGIWYLFGERMYSSNTPGIAKAFLDGRELIRPYGTFSHPNSLAGFFLLTGLFFLVNKDITNSVLKYGTIAFSSFLVLFSFSKNAIGTFVILHTIYAFREKKCRICIAATVVSTFAIAAVFFMTSTDAASMTKRMTLILQSLSIIGKHPIMGVGLGNYLYAQAEFPIKYPYFFLQPVHNIFLLAVSEIGVPTMLIAIGIAFEYLKKLRPHFGFLLLMTAVAATGMSDHYWLTLQQNLLLVPVILGSIMYNRKNYGKALKGN